jgi:uncharacterized protein (TIGR01777 family)
VKKNSEVKTQPDTQHLRIGVTGASGFIGTALCQALTQNGITVLRLVRHEPTADCEVSWNPEESFEPDDRLEGLDALVHLAGAGIAAKRWTPARREVLLRSRVDGTRFLVEALQRLDHPPTAFIQASAIGLYGNRGDEVLTEDSPQGEGFLAGLASAWEKASEPIEHSGARRICLRIGMVLCESGGVLARMKRPFRLGLGGRLGNGRHWVSWIELDDLVQIILRCCTDSSLRGPINAVAPTPLTNRAFTAHLARRWHRPAILPAPAWALKMAFGSMTSELLLASQRCIPAALESAGHQFSHVSLK